MKSMKRRLYSTIGRIILPLLFFSVVAASFTVIIDPGHGGSFTGAISKTGLKEKDLVLSIAQELALLCKDSKINAVLTRTVDTAHAQDLIQDLHARAAFTQKYKADAFISLHLNYSSNKKVQGYEVYVPQESVFPCKSYQLASTIHYQLSKNLEFKKDGVLGNLNAYDRGIRASRFHTLIQASCPAVLVELGYLSNAEDEKKLGTKAYRQKLAQCLVEAIASYSSACALSHLRK